MMRISPRLKLFAAAAAVCAAVAAGISFFAGKPEPKEHVFLVVADALRADVIGKVVNGSEVTPNLNKLARENVCFSRAYSAAPFTKASVASIFSGMYPPGHGVEHPVFTLPDCPTIARFLSGKGYYCIGFACNPFLAAEIASGAAIKPVDFGFKQGFDYYRTTVGREGETANSPAELAALVGGAATPAGPTGYVSGASINKALIHVLDNRPPFLAEDRPLFVYLHYMDSHQPWLPSAPIDGITGRFHARNSGSAAEIYANDVKVIYKALYSDEVEAPLAPEEAEDVRAMYLEAAAYLDGCVGELVAYLKAHGLYGDSAFIFTADHGDELFEHGDLGHSHNLFDESLRVPLIVKRKGLRPAEVKARVSNVSILPTIMEWFGGELGSTNAPSLVPCLRDGGFGGAPVFASFHGRDKIILPDGRVCMDAGGRKAYFNIESDPAESTPLDEDKAALGEMEKARFHSERLAREAGIRRRFSSFAWQNPWSTAQDAPLEKLVSSGGITRQEAARRKSFGEHMPEEALKTLAGDLEQIGFDDSKLTPQQKRQLKALGYLH